MSPEYKTNLHRLVLIFFETNTKIGAKYVPSGDSPCTSLSMAPTPLTQLPLSRVKKSAAAVCVSFFFFLSLVATFILFMSASIFLFVFLYFSPMFSP